MSSRDHSSLGQQGSRGSNTGHGHVYPRPDGLLARCGGPALCGQCAADAARKAATHEYVSTACQHEEHDQCRERCKFCTAACGCECHR